ncbi:Aspartyl/glutamyl-tRNA(Asn/Gln) amidotransferase subunit B [Thalassoglobus neptunius]|uniref:Aspartyl/glutamyl-tRNA(Asn/Gln) amidotransferase subunit B n=1 Tax=Thalassoglobus neptunius TaxID=1938619 RepID=A0A5C5X6I2_9PLAN|nr:Asp-tRNA(Asn)/Glu-tRNA(Gln) amidotransferase subunit GatB [Thalassoglobus neptunius]TWT58259.1 Aspartyl/glutamyl-tRNA(Asn/Gln) amidotransferase subunit B [Thalassoglobus neptunius]
MNVTTIVGLEVHVQLQTKTKIFCGCANRFNPDAPNTQVCPVCLGHPGTLPVMNKEAFDLSLITATALNCEIAEFTKWDRKQYFYPDLPKGYQISQYDLPFSKEGWLEIDGDDGNRRKIRINRAHLEEDAGKNIHDETGRGKDSQVDLNRAGTPLLEIVSEPDLRSGAEAKQYLEEMRLLLTFLDVSDCNMQEGSLRCDANVNLHLTDDAGQKIATPIVEVKNLNSFRAVEAAIDFEVQRQLKEYEKSGRKLCDPGVEKETRGWDANRNVSFAQRGKEDAADYRYFPDPDLVPVTVTKERIADVRAALPEAPATRRRRFEKELGLSTYDADVIVNQGRELASYFEEVVEVSGDGKQSANFVTQDVLREMKERGVEIGEFPVSASILGTIVKRVVDNKITTKSGREVFSALLEEADNDQEISTSRVDEMISERGLEVVSDTGALEEAVRSAIANCSSAVEDYRAGRKQAIGAIIGQVMKQAKGADAKAVRELIIQVIEETA